VASVSTTRSGSDEAVLPTVTKTSLSPTDSTSRLQENFMAIKTTRRALAAALGTTFVASLAASPIASAASNPFTMKPLASGYQVADNMAGKTNTENHCGAKDKYGKPLHCGGKTKSKKKMKKEGSCGGMK
jgi:uncharacterized low-complexity protein